MKLNNNRRIRGFSSLASMLLLLTIFWVSFGADPSTAQSVMQQTEKGNKLRRDVWRINRASLHKEFWRAALSRKDLPAAVAEANGFESEVFAPSGLSAVGNLDTSFGTGGKLTTSIGTFQSEALAAAAQADGRFIAAGYSFNNGNADFALTRYNANGTLDTTFGTGGKVTTAISAGDDLILGLVIQSADGKLIAAGTASNGIDDDFALVRYNPNGTLDTSFGTGGIVTTDFGSSSDCIDGVALQPDGKIVVAGYRFSDSFFHFALARYNPDGTLDASFGTGGKVLTTLTAFDDLARAILIQPDGKILVAGEANADFALVRYDSTGVLDTGFGIGGKVITSINTYDSAYDIGLQPDGKILTAGEEGDGINADFALVRYTSNGALDSLFGTGGVVTTAIGPSDEIARSLVIQANSQIILGGFSFNGRNDDFALARYNADGSLDASFGTGGKVTTGFGNSSFDYINALVIQSGTRVIGIGASGADFAAAAYLIGSYNISGAITYGTTPDGQSTKFVPGVVLNAIGNPSVSAVSNNSTGFYQLSGLGNGAYTVTPSKTGDVNSISSFDASLVARKAANLITLTPNQLIAADASGNGQVTSFDASLIARTAAGIANAGIAGQWKFNPPSKSYPGLIADLTNENYEAILVGEVSGNWIPPTTPAANSLINGNSSGSKKEETIRYKSVKVKPNQPTNHSDTRLATEAAQVTINVSLPANTTASSQSGVVIPVMVTDTTGQEIFSYDFTVTFNQSILTPTTCAAAVNSNTLSGASGFTITTSPGTGSVTISGFGSQALAGAGTLVNLCFNVAGTTGVTNLAFSSFVFNEGDPGANAVGGTFRVMGTTAATVAISGQVTTAVGRGIQNIRLSLTDSHGTVRITVTNSFGYYRFDDVEVGATHILSAAGKHHTFSQPVQILNINEQTDGVDFIAKFEKKTRVF